MKLLQKIIIQKLKNSSSTKYHSIICREESEKATTKESLEDIQSQLTLNQKEAALCLIAFFGGFNNNIEVQALLRIFRQAAHFLGLSTSTMEISQLMAKHSNADELIDTVISIKYKRAKDFIILSCHSKNFRRYSSSSIEIYKGLEINTLYNKNFKFDISSIGILCIVAWFYIV